jgi:hypothetical protein
MNSKLFFLILSAAMVAFTIVSICTAPSINTNYFSGTNNCQKDIDDYDKNKGNYDDNRKKKEKLKINVCKRENAMHDLEYTSLIFDVIVGTLCSILGLLHYFDVGKYCEKVTGIIGLASGVIGFILTIIYVGYSAYIFNNDHSDEGILYENGALYKWDGTNYVGDWKKEDEDKDYNAGKAKYKDLGKKQYNYNSELYKQYLKGEHKSISCNDGSKADPPSPFDKANRNPNCEYIWDEEYFDEINNSNKYIYDKWLTSIIFSSLTFICAIGVAIFGLLLFLNKGGSDHTPLS